MLLISLQNNLAGIAGSSIKTTQLKKKNYKDELRCLNEEHEMLVIAK